MKTTLSWIAAALLVAGCASPSTSSPSAYAGQEAREIKSLAPDEVAGLLAGKGLGYAKPAELNGYPGPSHVLELAARLELSAEQRSRTEALFAAMQAKAAQVGRALVDEERTSIDCSPPHRRRREPGRPPQRIGRLQARVRAAHLEGTSPRWRSSPRSRSPLHAPARLRRRRPLPPATERLRALVPEPQKYFRLLSKPPRAVSTR